MQDFCAISLSNLLTPWEAIEKRLKAAALGDFVVVLYNPRSLRRTWQLPEARRLLLEQRDRETPVGLIRDAYRPGQRISITDLDGLGALLEYVGYVHHRGCRELQHLPASGLHDHSEGVRKQAWRSVARGSSYYEKKTWSPGFRAEM